ncbi:hypothetical protein AZH11_05500 [Pseudomonas simiae]|nr:hypothetical protein AZH11_05500 [Pseudomonas simiae]
MSTFDREVNKVLDELEREALEVTYRPPQERSAQRFPLDEPMLNALREMNEKVRAVVMDSHARENSAPLFFRRGLTQPLR